MPAIRSPQWVKLWVKVLDFQGFRTKTSRCTFIISLLTGLHDACRHLNCPTSNWILPIIFLTIKGYSSMQIALIFCNTIWSEWPWFYSMCWSDIGFISFWFLILLHSWAFSNPSFCFPASLPCFCSDVMNAFSFWFLFTWRFDIVSQIRSPLYLLDDMDTMEEYSGTILLFTLYLSCSALLFVIALTSRFMPSLTHSASFFHHVMNWLHYITIANWHDEHSTLLLTSISGFMLHPRHAFVFTGFWGREHNNLQIIKKAHLPYQVRHDCTCSLMQLSLHLYLTSLSSGAWSISSLFRSLIMISIVLANKHIAL